MIVFRRQPGIASHVMLFEVDTDEHEMDRTWHKTQDQCCYAGHSVCYLLSLTVSKIRPLCCDRMIVQIHPWNRLCQLIHSLIQCSVELQKARQNVLKPANPNARYDLKRLKFGLV
eukprot:scpid48167/ scgid21107/ 